MQYKFIMLALLLSFSLVLSSCGGRDATTGDSAAAPVDNTGDTGTPSDNTDGINPPENVGSPDDVNFGLEGPGSTNFDDVGLQGSQPSVEPVGEPQGSDTFTYDIPENNDSDSQTPTLNTESGGGDDGTTVVDTPVPGSNLQLEMDNNNDRRDENSGTHTVDTPNQGQGQNSTSTPAPMPTPPVTKPNDKKDVPASVALPNTGIFLEDD